jgi:hypothetical protein
MEAGAAVGRAFNLAKSGECRSVSEIIRRLAIEDRELVEDYPTTPNARRQLILICSEAWLAAR